MELHMKNMNENMRNMHEKMQKNKYENMPENMLLIICVKNMQE